MVISDGVGNTLTVICHDRRHREQLRHPYLAVVGFSRSTHSRSNAQSNSDRDYCDDGFVRGRRVGNSIFF